MFLNGLSEIDSCTTSTEVTEVLPDTVFYINMSNSSSKFWFWLPICKNINYIPCIFLNVHKHPKVYISSFWDKMGSSFLSLQNHSAWINVVCYKSGFCWKLKAALKVTSTRPVLLPSSLSHWTRFFWTNIWSKLLLGKVKARMFHPFKTWLVTWHSSENLPTKKLSDGFSLQWSSIHLLPGAVWSEKMFVQRLQWPLYTNMCGVV